LQFYLPTYLLKGDIYLLRDIPPFHRSFHDQHERDISRYRERSRALEYSIFFSWQFATMSSMLGDAGVLLPANNYFSRKSWEFSRTQF
jgi:hypothetical protein